ncbi:AraC family transcriptional regulator [Aeromonas molluscorum]|uniref:DNA gyrase inhibitor n=1 Tax=Aeromonas molluscorum 848 TaxID=1268236 RepID=R1H5D8_9GAMM|nr:AraC family transcriptional regulator [Aeromonas molluscorum]EOD55751.1 DNA gyrase inhibitor [Aeromonas molluscorum 848]
MIDYKVRLRPAIRALEQNPELSLTEVAALACLSCYHFHRVFTAVTGESPGEMQRRLRLERAAVALRYGSDPVTSIALGAGFASSQAFAKAFRKQFAMTPGELRRYPHRLQESKNGHGDRKDGHASSPPPGQDEEVSNERSFRMKTEQMSGRTLAYIRVTGPYGEGYDPVCQRLYQWASARGLAEAEWVFIYHDNPEVTAPELCRTDIGVTAPAGTTGSAEIEIQQMPAGRYAQSRYIITDRSQYGPLWQEHIGDLVAAGLAFGDGPCFELYHSTSNDPLRDDVSFCSSVQD